MRLHHSYIPGYPWPSQCLSGSSSSSEDGYNSASSAGTEVNANDGNRHNRNSCYFIPFGRVAGKPSVSIRHGSQWLTHVSKDMRV